MRTLLLLVGLLTLAGCGADKITADAADPSKAAKVSLERHFQRVIRYNCESRVVSDQIETVKSPTTLVEILPRRGDISNIQSSSIYNNTTGSSGTIINSTTITLDYAPGFFNHRVRSGLNEFRFIYVFRDGDREEGTRYIDVSYSETTLQGFSEVRPSAEDCIQPPKR